jgi:hypothetical protein
MAWVLVVVLGNAGVWLTDQSGGARKWISGGMPLWRRLRSVIPSVVNIRHGPRWCAAMIAYEELLRRLLRIQRSTPKPGKSVRSRSIASVPDEVGRDEGYILTNQHVIAARQPRAGATVGRARIRSRETAVDYARKIWRCCKHRPKRPGDKPFKPITLAKDDDLLLGETVIADGQSLWPRRLGVARHFEFQKSPAGFAGSHAAGVRRTGCKRMRISIPGNSGGPLINIRGELIGINAATFSIRPLARARASPFRSNRFPVRSPTFFTLEWSAKLWLGARFRGAPYPLSVREVQSTVQPDRAGLRVGHEIVEVNGKPVNNLAALNLHIGRRPVPTGGRPSLFNDNGARRESATWNWCRWLT